MIKSEINRVFMSKRIYIIILLGVIAGCSGFITYNENVFFHKATNQMESISAFEAWFYTLAIGSGTLLKLILPALISIPFADSYLYDKKSGYINSVRVRSSYSKYIFSKIIANALAGATVIFSVFLILFIVSATFYPLNFPNTEINYKPYGVFYDLYIHKPYFYVSFILLLGSFFGAVYATLGLSASVLFNNRFAVIAFPFLYFIFLVVLSQILNLKFLMPVSLVTPFNIIDVTALDIAFGYCLTIVFTLSLTASMIYKGKSEVN